MGGAGRSSGKRASIPPQLSVRNGRAAIDFYRAAFGAVEDYRVGGTDADESVVAQLSVGDASFWVSDEAPSHGSFSPQTLGGATARMLLIVEDPDSALDQAVAAGARECSRSARSTAGAWGGSRIPSATPGRSEGR